MEQREHSKAYTNFFRQLNATGMERAYGAYAPDTLEKIHDWERSDVEKTIWRGFKYKDDADLAELVTGIIDATESGVYIVFYEAENMYIPSVLSEEMAVKPAIGDKVVLLKKQKGQSIIKSISQERSLL